MGKKLLTSVRKIREKFPNNIITKGVFLCIVEDPKRQNYRTASCFTKKWKIKENPMFFGLEPSISVWYIYELGKWEPESTIEPKKTKLHSTKTGYLYVLQATRDIPITRIIDKLIDHPTECSDCWKEKKGVCIHPQQIWHGDSDRVRDLGIEVTLRPREFKDHLQLMTIDPILVEKPK